MSQFKEAIVQIACVSSVQIPTLVKVYIKNYAYNVNVEVTGQCLQKLLTVFVVAFKKSSDDSL